MNPDQTTIAVDAMGGDKSPYKSLKGVEIFLQENKNTKIILFGDKNLIKNTINSHNIKIANFEIVNTLENILDEDSANIILRKKKDNSINKGLEIIKKIKFSGFVSAGNTAALMILSRLKLGMIEGIDRPAICSVIPNKKNFSIMLDLGANVNVTAKNLLQFAIMGYSYHNFLKPNIKPRIGIINIGTENNKGLDLLQEASELISLSHLKDFYRGFIEPNKITSGQCDIMISDGYTGNIMLKTAEGMSEFITSNLKNVFYKSLKNKIAYSILKSDLIKFKDQINPDKYNGAILMGVNGISVKSHGGATPYAFSCALKKCDDFIRNDINKKIRQNFIAFNI